MAKTCPYCDEHDCQYSHPKGGDGFSLVRSPEEEKEVALLHPCRLTQGYNALCAAENLVGLCPPFQGTAVRTALECEGHDIVFYRGVEGDLGGPWGFVSDKYRSLIGPGDGWRWCPSKDWRRFVRKALEKAAAEAPAGDLRHAGHFAHLARTRFPSTVWTPLAKAVLGELRTGAIRVSHYQGAAGDPDPDLPEDLSKDWSCVHLYLTEPKPNPQLPTRIKCAARIWRAALLSRVLEEGGVP